MQHPEPVRYNLETTMYKPKPAHNLPALFVLMLSMMAACFWPFNFHPHNDVVYLPGEQALRFNGLGTAYSRDPFPSLRELSESNELTVEMTVRPARIYNHDLPCILSFVSEQGHPALKIGAWKKSLVVRLGRPGNSGWKQYQEIGVADVFTPGQAVHLVISMGPEGTTISVNANIEKFFPDASLDTSNAPLGRLLLGNSDTGGSLWKGEILALALYDRALSTAERTQGTEVAVQSNDNLIAHYRFDQSQNNLIPNTAGSQFDIIVPTYFAPLRRTVLEPPRGGTDLRRWFLKDIVLNIAGFVPFGFLMMLYLSTASAISPRRLSTAVVILGFLFSLVIELTQAFLPTRSSSLTDLAMNTLGTAVGVLILFILSTWKLEVVDEEVAIS